MTVRIAQEIGIDKLAKFAKNLKIYDDPEQLLSISLGSAETTLLKLTTAYSSFVNGGKLIEPIFLDRIQDSEGNTIYSSEKRVCEKCKEISYIGDEIPKIKNNFKQVISEETAYQMTSILEGVIKRGTGKGLKNLNLDLAGKTGTTNDNTDAWFIGFTSNLVIGVYVGNDEPKSLGKYETGSKTAMPIFKSFVKKAIKKGDARPFKVAKNIKFLVIDQKSGKKADFGSKTTIIEAFKKQDLKKNFVENDNLNLNVDKNNILKFY